MLGLDGVLASAVIAHRFTRSHDTLRERSFTDYLPWPQFIEQFVFGDNTLMVLD
jgi:hypothetical protein